MRCARPLPHTRLQARAPRRMSPYRAPLTGDLRSFFVASGQGERAPHVQDARRVRVDGGGRVGGGAGLAADDPERKGGGAIDDLRGGRLSRPPRIGPFRWAPASWSPSRRTTSGASLCWAQASFGWAQVASRGRRRARRGVAVAAGAGVRGGGTRAAASSCAAARACRMCGRSAALSGGTG